MKEKYQKLQEVLEKYKPELLKKAGVTAVGIGYKVKKGKQLKKLAIICFVEKKLGLEVLAEKDIVPKELNGILTDVIESGKLEAKQNPKLKYRPALGGVSCMWYLGSTCTLSCRVWKNGKPYILQNAHCGFPFWEGAKVNDSILQPSPFDGGKMEDQIGKAFVFAPLEVDKENLADACLVEILEPQDVSDEILGIGKFEPEMKEVKLGQKIYKSGRTSGLTLGKIIAIKATATVWYDWQGERRTLTFKDQIITKAFVQGGDSSSLGLLKVNKKYYPCGLVFAGSEEISILNRIQNVTQLLGFRFLPFSE